MSVILATSLAHQVSQSRIETDLLVESIAWLGPD
jgi:hypothetical protein